MNDFINATTIRLITSSTYETIKRERFIKRTKCINSLKRFVNKFERRTKVKAQNMKKITSFATSSWWTSSSIRIMKNKKIVEKNHKKQLETISINYIYFDENDINDKINAATISSETSLFTTRTYLKFITSYTIYSAKLYEIALTRSMKLYSFDEMIKKSKLIICVDNQATIQTIHNFENNSKQHMMQ